jgi:superfamily II DNA or RNA helicase
MRKTPRPHQVETITKLREYLISGRKRPVIMLPTGAGKTLVAAMIVEGALAKGNKVIFVVPALSLIDQTVAAFAAEGIYDVGVIQANHPRTNWLAPVQVASIQTLMKREIPPASLIIVDECHMAFQFIYEWMAREEWRKTPFIGLSATPWTKGMGKHYDALIVGETTQGLIDKKLLVPFRVFAPAHPDLSGVKKVAGDYHEGQLSDVMGQKSLVAGVVQTWLEKGENRPTFCFAVDCAHAKKLQAEFEQGGVNCGYIDAYTKQPERAELKQKFESGEIKVICSVGTMIVGVDWDCRCLIWARPTQSKMLYCLDMETEILTSHGWKKSGEIKVGDCVASMADIVTSRGAWGTVLSVIERPMDNTETWIEYNAPRANFRVTNNHNMIFSLERENPYIIKPAKELLGNRSVYMPTAVNMQQTGVPLTDSELYFIGMMLSDGSWTSTQGNISQSERYPQIINRIEKCLQNCGIGYSKRKRLPNKGDNFTENYSRWVFSFSAGKPKAHASRGRWQGKDISCNQYQKFEGISGFQHLLPYMDKDFSPALLAMSKLQFEVFLRGLWDGDGIKKENVDYIPQSISICSARPLLMDRLQALCAINGMTANIRKEQTKNRKNPLIVITITPKSWRCCGGYDHKGRAPRPAINETPSTPEKVWCVESEHGTIITRRRGKVTVMGNCQGTGRALRTAEGKADALILDHSDNTLRLGFVTDIQAGELDMGKKKNASEKKERKQPLPKECPACQYLKELKVHKCPNCGFAPVKQSDVVEQEGSLIEVKGKKKHSMDDKQAWYSGLLYIGKERGYSSGRIAHLYRDKFGIWPRGLQEIEIYPSVEVSNFVRAKNIAYAKSQEKLKKQGMQYAHAN